MSISSTIPLYSHNGTYYGGSDNLFLEIETQIPFGLG
jgi:hypothetical protein